MARQSVEEFAALVAEAMGLDAEGIEDAQNWPNENLLPLVHDMRIAAARWRWLLPRLSAHPGGSGTTHVEAWLPTTYFYGDCRGSSVSDAVDRCMAAERKSAESEEAKNAQF